MAAYNKYTAAIEAMNEVINAGSDTWKFALAATVNAADTTFTPGSTDLATGGGYTQGGNAATVASSSQTGGVFKLVLNAPSMWTASAGGFTWRYVILWNVTNSIPVAYWDYGTSVVMSGTNGDTFTFTPDAVNGVYQNS